MESKKPITDYQLPVTIIVSGGQTGVDRAAFDVALEKGLAIEGWVPKDRIAEDGPIDDRYGNLRETASGDPAVRTELNVRDSDATLIISSGKLDGGSRLTVKFAKKHDKPFIHIDLDSMTNVRAVEETRKWLALLLPKRFNIAGPRASEDREIYQKAKEFLTKLFD